MSTIRFGQKTYRLPANRLLRIVIGLALIMGGFLGFLPILGFWMIPLGLVVLSVDIPAVRRWRRRMTVKLGAWLKRRYPGMAARLGFNSMPANGNGGTQS